VGGRIFISRAVVVVFMSDSSSAKDSKRSRGSGGVMVVSVLSELVSDSNSKSSSVKKFWVLCWVCP
jgi:hypothetical protein